MLCVHPPSVCQSGLKVMVYGYTNMCILESINERCEFLNFFLSLCLRPCFSSVHLRAVIKYCSAHSYNPIKVCEKQQMKKGHIKHEGQNIFIHCLPKKPTSKAGINGRRAFVVVILLVVKRKVLGSLWNGSDVISVRKDIWSAVDHIWADFPGADASQCGDLFGFGSERLCTALLAQLMRSCGSTGLQELYFEIGSCCIWLM